LRPNIWHQTGKDKLEQVINAYEYLGVDARSEEFIQSVDTAYEWADIIICRAGALTVSEVAVAGVPAIFIPYPYAIDNHQSTNAKWLVKNQGAMMIEQSEMTVKTLNEILISLLCNKEKINTMSTNLKKLAMPDATQQVVAVCEQACCGENHNVA
jgi:UDP-N-acetylglucosamine--N-acetylmuramyl-(pentapeptide) pyrophosphoryl-undecaprenol N-acetylglucosamine transferase